jgi:hypothetical protein
MFAERLGGFARAIRQGDYKTAGNDIVGGLTWFGEGAAVVLYGLVLLAWWLLKVGLLLLLVGVAFWICFVNPPQSAAYWTGVVVSFLWAVVAFFWVVSASFGTEGENLKRVGLRLELTTGMYKAGGSFIGELPSLVFYTLLATLLSWVGVVINALVLVYFRRKRSGEPPVLKEFRWKVRNVPMTKELLEAEWARVEKSLFGESRSMAGQASKRQDEEPWNQLEAEATEPATPIPLTDEVKPPGRS